MSEPRNDGPGGRASPSGASAPEGRATGSSLTDAVVAALANVSHSHAPSASATVADGSGEREAPSVDAASSDEPGSSVDAASSDALGSPVEASTSDPEDASSVGSLAGADETAPDSTVIDEKASEPPAARADEPATEARPVERESHAPTIVVGDVPAGDVPAGDVPVGDAPAGDVPVGDAPGENGSGQAVAGDAVSSEAAPGEPATAISSKPVPEGIVVEYYGRTDVGLVREHNEDNFLVVDLSLEQKRGIDDPPELLRSTLGTRGLVLAVCDGMGGAAAGEVASQMAVDTVHEIMQAGGPPRDRDQLARRLVRAVEEAGARIFSAAKMDRTRRGMGTTATVAAIVDSTVFVGQVGDSRAYVLRGDQFALITKDQSLVNQLIEAGQLTEEEAEAFEHSNIILQALGTTEEVTVDLTFLELRRGDRLLMCSDGLSGLVHGEMMKEVLKSSRDLGDAAQQLIAMANAGGGHDNITVILAEFDGTTLRETSADARVAYQQYPLPPEDPSQAEVLPARTTAMKSGGPKPGADVKHDSGRVVRAREPASSSRLWVVGLVLLVILIGAAAMILSMDDGEHVDAADTEDTTRVTIASTVSSRRASPASQAAEGRIRVRTDVSEGVLFVNGARHAGGLAGGVTLDLPAGAYRLEVREGDVRVAEHVVTLEPGQHEDVDLSTPAGALPEPGLIASPTVSAPVLGSRLAAATEGDAPNDLEPAPTPAATSEAASAAAAPAAPGQVL